MGFLNRIGGMAEDTDTASVVQVVAKPRMEWTPPVEKLLASWCDHAKCYVWMHSKAYDEVDKRLRRFMITIHVFSTIAGLSNIITGDTDVGGFKVAWLYGGITILLTSLSLLQEKMGLAERVSNHRKLAFQSLIIKMKIEEVLSLPRDARGDCKTFLRYIKTDINNSMLEKNAGIPHRIRDACYESFKNIPNFDIPDICGQVEHTEVYVEEPQSTHVILTAPVPITGVAMEKKKTLKTMVSECTETGKKEPLLTKSRIFPALVSEKGALGPLGDKIEASDDR
jgi:hypothetical protein